MKKTLTWDGMTREEIQALPHTTLLSVHGTHMKDSLLRLWQFGEYWADRNDGGWEWRWR